MTWNHKGMANTHVQMQQTYIEVVQQADEGLFRVALLAMGTKEATLLAMTQGI